MKSIICSVLVGLFLVTVFKLSRTNAVSVDLTAQNEVNRLFHAQEPMCGNITLKSNSSLGTGAFAFVLSGETDDGTPVAIKATSIEKLDSYNQEYHCYEKMNATTDKVCERHGIPFIYHSGDFLNYKTMAMTKLDSTLTSLRNKKRLFSNDTILILFRDLIKTLKFTHSKGIMHQDIGTNNIMTKGANVFLMDFNLGVDQKLQNHPRVDSNLASTLATLYKQDSAPHFDMMCLFNTMCTLTYMQASCYPDEILKSGNGISEQKRKMKEEIILNKTKYAEFIDPYVEFCFDAIDAMEKKRLPKYDHFYKIFDDLLYAGRNRSERIVFEWLTPEERAAAIAESILPIESIVFPEKMSINELGFKFKIKFKIKLFN